MDFMLVSIIDPDVFKALNKINNDKTIFTKQNNTSCTSLLYLMKSKNGKEICRFPYRKGIGVVLAGEDDIEILSTSKFNATSSHQKQQMQIFQKNQNRFDNVNCIFGRKTYQIPGYI